MDNIEANVRKWIRENEAKLVQLTQELVQIPSITGQEKQIQEYVFRKLETLDLSPEYVYPDLGLLKSHEEYFETTSFTQYGYEDRPNVVGTLKGSGGEGKSICLSGHIDVVSPEPIDGWTYGPWSGDEEDGKIYGRGSADMKAGVAAMIFAVEALKTLGLTLQGDIFVETTIEEEDGGVGGNLFMRMTQPKADGAINPEPSALNLSIASAGVMYFRITVEGFPAHAATAHFGINAIHKMQPIIEVLKGLNEDRKRRISYPYAEDSDPRMKGHATTINLGVIQAGDWPSTVPGTCIIECRIGWPPGETREEVMSEVETSVHTAIREDPWFERHPPQIEWFGWKAKPHEQDITDPFIQLLMKKAEEVSGKTPLLYGGAAGLDTRFFAHYGIPSATFGPKGERTHSTDECVHIDSIIKTAEAIATVIINWCRTKS